MGKKATDRLEGVYSNVAQKNHQVIQAALDLGCTDTYPVTAGNILLRAPGCSKHTIASMKTEAGNSYGEYFVGDNDALVFAPDVWRRLQELRWTAIHRKA